jgi:hypothetical protein
MATISPPFFYVVGTSVIRGRRFTDADGSRGSETAIINKRMAAEHFKADDPL